MDVLKSNLWTLVMTSLHFQMPKFPSLLQNRKKRKGLRLQSSTHPAAKIPVIILDRYEDLQPSFPPLTC